MRICKFIAISVILLLATSSSSFNEESAGPSASISEIDTPVHELMLTYKIPDLSLAITKDGNLVYAKAYGLNYTVSLKDRFRIASVSKPITSIAIMKLVEEGAFSLDDKIFGPEGILGTKYGTKPYNSFAQEISVLHLLQHTSGGWTIDDNDPMFLNPSLSADELISWTLDNQPLTVSPGTIFAYSNFGYFILGRVIEQVTSQSYEDYVQSAVLALIGITDMEIAGNTKAGRKSHEVEYFAQEGQTGVSGIDPYSFNIARLDAHGGWIATATDLVKLLVHVDGFDTKPDILSNQSIKIMTTPSEINPRYALGWMVKEEGTWMHGGALPGTHAMLVRTAGGFGVAIITNILSDDPQFAADIDELVFSLIINPDIQWPEIDLL